MVNNHNQLEPTGRPVKFYNPMQWLNEQRRAIKYVFEKYKLKVKPTRGNLKLAYQVALQKDKPEFIQDLQNAFIKRSVLGHHNFEDNYDYTIADAYEEDYDGEETIHYFEEVNDEYDEFAGKLKAKRAARKVKRKSKKLSKVQKRALKVAEKMKEADNAHKGLDMIEKLTTPAAAEQGSSESGGTSIGEKIEKGLGIVGDLATAGANIAGAFIGNKSNDNGAGTTYANDDNDGGDDDDENSDDDSGSGMSANKKYIIAGIAIIAVIGLLFFVMKKRKS